MDLNEGGDLKREREREASSSCHARAVGQILSLDDVTRGWVVLASGKRRGCRRGWSPAPPPQHPGGMPALLAAGGSGLWRLGCLQSCIFGECFTLGNRPGILKGRPPPSPAKVSFSCFRKEVPRKERQPGCSLSLYHYSLHSPETSHSETIRQP